LEVLSSRSLTSLRLDHLLALTDDVGVIQHSKFSVPDRSTGYTTDDNARALVFVAKMTQLASDQLFVELARKYLSFLKLMHGEAGGVHNFLGYERQYLDEGSVGDHVGRALWACGAVLNSDLSDGLKAPAHYLFDSLTGQASAFPLRAEAYAVLGLTERYRAERTSSPMERVIALADSIVERYGAESSTGWKWFEPVITYDNPRLPQCLFEAFAVTGDAKYLDVAQESLEFLFEAEMRDGAFSPIGNRGWFTRRGERALYDQQPVEAGAMVEAAATAYSATQSELYLAMIERGLAWFHGANLKGAAIYDPSTGASYDGLLPDGVNLNQGAESTLAYLLAVAKLASLSRRVKTSLAELTQPSAIR